MTSTTSSVTDLNGQYR